MPENIIATFLDSSSHGMDPPSLLPPVQEVPCTVDLTLVPDGTLGENLL